jgi:aflatoxin B1 aldehyde reductase
LLGGAMIDTSFSTPEQVRSLLDQLKTLGADRIDTAARYSPAAPGSSERLLGETRAAEQGFTIDTKINTVSGDGAGTLTATAIEKSLEESLSRLHMSKVNILHFHRPDPQTPVVEQAAEIHRQYLAGRFDKVYSPVLDVEVVVSILTWQ